MESNNRVNIKYLDKSFSISLDDNDFNINDYLSKYGLYHLIKEKYNEEELEKLIEILNVYCSSTNIIKINFSSAIAANWWANYLANPILRDESTWKTCLKVLYSWRDVYKYNNQISNVLYFEKILSSLIKLELLYSDELILDSNSNLIKKALINSDCIYKNKDNFKMLITKNEVILTDNDRYTTLYCNYEKTKKK